MGGTEREREKEEAEGMKPDSVRVCVCAQMYMGGINDQCVTGIHLFESCGFSNWTEVLMGMIY